MLGEPLEKSLKKKILEKTDGIPETKNLGGIPAEISGGIPGKNPGENQDELLG